MAEPAGTRGPDPRPGATPGVTHRRVLALAVPVMLSNATVPLLGAVDTGVVGQMGLAAPIGAVSLGGVLLSAIYWLFGFLRMGTAGLAAQAHGAGDAVEGGAVLGRALLTALGAGVLLVLLQAPLLALIMISSPASEEVEALAETYIGIRIWAAPAAISVFALTGWLIGQGRTGAVLTLQLLMNGVNAALSVWLGLGLGWGVAGVAIATAVAEGTGAILGLWLCRAAFQGTAWRTAARLFDHVALRRLAGINGDILLRSLLLEVSIISFVLFGAGFGDVALAANQILLQFLLIAANAIDGFAIAAEALVGQAMGARDRAGLRRAAERAGLWGMVCGLTLAAGFWLAGPAAIGLMTTVPEVRAVAENTLIWMALVPLLAAPAFILDGIFIGATETRVLRNAMLQSFAIFVLALVPALLILGNPGLWVAQLVFFVARGVVLYRRYPALEARAGPGSRHADPL